MSAGDEKSYDIFLETVGLKNPYDPKIIVLQPDTSPFDPTTKFDVSRFDVIDRTRALTLNWCRDVLNVYYGKADRSILESAYLVVKLLFDYIIFNVLKGRVNFDYMQLIACACLFCIIARAHLLYGEEQNQGELATRLITNTKYSRKALIKVIKYFGEYHNDFIISTKNIQADYIKQNGPKKFKENEDYNEGDVDVYNGPTDQKWESDVNEMNQLFLASIKTIPFTHLLRLKSFGINKQRISDHELLHHPILNDFFEVAIECANTIMENVVFTIYGNKLTKDPRRRGVFAFTCLTIAFKQQGAFDWVSDRSDFAHYFSSVLRTPKEEMNKLELKLLMLTNWEGCKEISERMEMKTYRKYDELFQIGKKKSVRKSKGKGKKKILRKKSVKKSLRK